MAENPAISAAFDRYEAQAKKNKAAYRFWAVSSVWMIASGALYTIAWMTFGVDSPALSILFLIFAVSALVIQAALWRLEAKNAWLKARFAAEQLRSIKFQAFALAAQAGGSGAAECIDGGLYPAPACRADRQTEFAAGGVEGIFA